jgi:hypothetical protein
LWSLIRSTPALDWFLLTKRPQNIRDMLPTDWGEGWPHVWLGTTTENQEEANRRIPHLVAIPAAVRFLSVEPMLEPVDVLPWLVLPSHGGRAPISWIIVGGESGGGARPMHPDWVRGLRDQVRAADAKLFVKQNRQQSRALAKCQRQGRRPGAMAGRFAGTGIPAVKSFPHRAARAGDQNDYRSPLGATVRGQPVDPFWLHLFRGKRPTYFERGTDVSNTASSTGESANHRSPRRTG